MKKAQMRRARQMRRLGLTLFLLGFIPLAGGLGAKYFFPQVMPAQVPTAQSEPQLTPEVQRAWTQWIETDIPGMEHAYFIGQLNEQDKALCKGLYQGIASFQEEIVLPEPIHNDKLSQLMWLIKYDCPELFQISGEYTYYVRENAPDMVFSVRPTFTFTSAQYQAAYAEVEAVLSNWREQTQGLDAYETEKFMYDKLMATCTYREEGEHTGTVYGALVLGEARCEGYSQALSMALRSTGIECLILTGEARAQAGENTPGKLERHAWNVAQIGGRFYQLDATWDDADDVLTSGSAYAHFNVTDAEMYKNRTLDPIFDVLIPPVCDAMTYNYFSVTDQYITAEKNTRDVLFDMLDEAREQTNDGASFPPVSAKLQSDEQFLELQEHFKEWMNAWYTKHRASGAYSWVTYPDSRVFSIADMSFEQ